MKFLLTHILIILGISKAYAGTSNHFKDIVPMAKEKSGAESGGGDKPGQGCGGGGCK